MSPSRLTIAAAFLLLLPTPALASECYALTVPVAAGDYVDASEMTVVACREHASDAPLAFDRGARALRASAAMGAGEYLGPLVIEAGSVVQPGDAMVLVFRKGPVTVERDVRPLVPMRSGEHGIVRAEDGTVFRATFIPAERAQ